MAAFEYRQAEEVRAAFDEQGVRYLFLGKSGAILLGFPDTTQDADLFMERSIANGEAAVVALEHLGFALAEDQKAEIRVVSSLLCKHRFSGCLVLARYPEYFPV